MELDEIERQAWTQLQSAVLEATADFRFVNLCSVDGAGNPQARIVVVRQVDRSGRVIEFHTDIRSPKWKELHSNHNATVLGYSQSARLQLRLQGVVELHGPETKVADDAWQNLSVWTRTTYTGGPPGDYVSCNDQYTANAEDRSEGKDVFGLIRFRANSLDWFQLARGENRRGQFDYDVEGQLCRSQWVHP
ncbi:pyridoxamine 5'-phosphate oxidase family protein [Brucella sp. NBRC 12950]|uniref:pyridoxamine 5'-phosphate oxidase family protein n=1 Tax=Brucella sp. NBRC 12950 TaxID=2994518 RepID=UPI0024A3A192|nr:pyridoxamine 5'-phosphate oxidase family protein [Brucella sp. NBRC 12950]GLU28065.1 hypothetical protein Brsp01_32980 [Brucella sp. NBRC 12950]